MLECLDATKCDIDGLVRGVVGLSVVKACRVMIGVSGVEAERLRDL